MSTLAPNRALVDGNKRLALAATIAFLGVNGRRFSLSNDAAYNLVIAVEAGELDSVEEIAALLTQGSEARTPD